MRPSIAIIIPTYNRPDLLEKAVASCHAQTHPDIEIVVVDDGSTKPPRAAWIAEEEARGVVFLRTANGGPAVARRHGVAASRSTHVLFLDDDDRLMPHAIATLWELARAAPALVAVSGAAVTDTATRSDPHVRTPPLPCVTRRDLLTENGITIGATLVRRTAFDEVGGWRAEFTGIEDWDLWLRLTAIGKIGTTPETILHYLVHDQSLTHSIRPAAAAFAMAVAFTNAAATRAQRAEATTLASSIMRIYFKEILWAIRLDWKLATGQRNPVVRAGRQSALRMLRQHPALVPRAATEVTKLFLGFTRKWLP